MQAIVVLISLALVFGFLAIERIAVRRVRSRIPTRIVVLGTRGKSSVVRLIAFGLRASGRRIVYKTTGSRAVFGHVDGSEERIVRRSLPTPLEQRRILRKAAREHADIAIIEAMSIRPESLRAEVRQILSPGIAVIATVGEDHVVDIEDPCAAFAAAVPRSALVIASKSAPQDLFEHLDRRGVRIRQAEPPPKHGDVSFAGHLEWQDNIDLALTACRAVGVAETTAAQGLAGVVADLGALSAWRLPSVTSHWIAVNGFAANDPGATRQVLTKALERWGAGVSPVVGILNLRRDRGDRTLQWMDALSHDRWPFNHLIVTGHTPWELRRSVRRALRGRVRFVASGDADRIMAEVSAVAPAGGLLFGLGNIVGIGEQLVDTWSDRGETL